MLTLCSALVVCDRFGQVEMRKVLGEYAGAGVSFMDGALMKGFEKRWRVRT